MRAAGMREWVLIPDYSGDGTCSGTSSSSPPRLPRAQSPGTLPKADAAGRPAFRYDRSAGHVLQAAGPGPAEPVQVSLSSSEDAGGPEAEIDQTLGDLVSAGVRTG